MSSTIHHQYRRGQTIYDLITRDYYQIEVIQHLMMWGTERVFIKLEGVRGLRAEDAWRELDEITPRHESYLLKENIFP